MSNNVSAVIVSYNPNINIIGNLIDNLLDQNSEIIIVDNGSNNYIEIENLKNKKNINIILLGENFGIAKAQNIGINEAIRMNYEYIIIFDQDSMIERNFVSSLMKTHNILKNAGKKIATVGPTFIDTKTSQKSYALRYEGLKLKKVYSTPDHLAIESDYIISSGSLIHIDVFKDCGFMNEELFIDFVDIEWGLRAKKKGYVSYMACNNYMNHTIGDSSVKLPVLNKFINIHSNFRKYFIVRNAIYLIFYSDLPINWKLIQMLKTFFYMISILIASKERLSIIKIFFKGILDGIFRKMGKGSM